MPKHLTNLESEARVLDDVAKAESALAQTDPTNEQAFRAATAQQIHAQLRADNWKATHDMLAKEYGTLKIDRPKPTKWRTAKQLEAIGLVGIYAEA